MLRAAHDGPESLAGLRRFVSDVEKARYAAAPRRLRWRTAPRSQEAVSQAPGPSDYSRSLQGHSHLSRLGERESGTERLEAAVAAYQAALLERKRARRSIGRIRSTISAMPLEFWEGPHPWRIVREHGITGSPRLTHGCEDHLQRRDARSRSTFGNLSGLPLRLFRHAPIIMGLFSGP
jgi:hypothetical protein